MIFRRTVVLQSALERAKIIERLRFITAAGGRGVAGEKKFEGEIGDDGFRILLVKELGHNDRIRPEIKGRIEEDAAQSSCKVILDFDLPRSLKWLWYFVFVFNSVIVAAALLFPDRLPLEVSDKWWLVLVFFVAYFLIFLLTYQARVSKAAEILRRIAKSSG